MAAEEPADEGYEQLVRQQLDALGYDSAAIPDDVRAPNMNLHMCPVTRLFCTCLPGVARIPQGLRQQDGDPRGVQRNGGTGCPPGRCLKRSALGEDLR